MNCWARDEKQITRNIKRIRLDKNLSQEKLAKLSGLMKGYISKIESETFNDAYHIPVRFGSGSCKRLFCPDTDCVPLIPGNPCAHPCKARSAIEAVGMDANTMATKVGWEMYPIGRSRSP